MNSLRLYILLHDIYIRKCINLILGHLSGLSLTVAPQLVSLQINFTKNQTYLAHLYNVVFVKSSHTLLNYSVFCQTFIEVKIKTLKTHGSHHFVM